VAVAEMVLAALVEGREIGAAIELPEECASSAAWCFGEDQARYIVTAPENSTQAILNDAARAKIPINCIGLSGGATLTLGSSNAISLDELKRAHEDWLPNYMATTDGRNGSGD